MANFLGPPVQLGGNPRFLGPPVAQPPPHYLGPPVPAPQVGIEPPPGLYPPLPSRGLWPLPQPRYPGLRRAFPAQRRRRAAMLALAQYGHHYPR